MFVPSEAFLTKGVGRHKEKLTSFEMALREARIAQHNLVRISSIWPPHCRMVTRRSGLNRLKPGQVVFSVVAEAATNEPSRRATASIGLAVPADPKHYGYISEHHGFGIGKRESGDYAEDLAASMLATVLGVEFDPEQAWDDRRERWLLSGKIVRTTNISCTAEARNDGRWVTVISALVFCG
ncbi:MAG: pyruvoyl-dependent arginine decarboxylase [Gemmatimonadales bacterium]